jgi:hypothetical protein
VSNARPGRLSALMAAAGLLVLTVAGPASARVAQRPDGMSADLDGKPIQLVQVGQWYCHDFDYPRIHCFTDPRSLDGSTSLAVAGTGVVYATVYEFTTYQGAYMHMSENYSALSLLGWNDRISSYVAKNSMSGAFWTDWLYGGTRYNFCCNQSLGSLGSFDNTFSSVFHN